MTTEVIRTENLTKRYGDRNVVDHLDLSVPQGVVYGFMGLNGAGKSTTMKMLLGLTTPTDGRIEVFGQPLDKNLSSILTRTGSLIEGPSYPNLTGAENLVILQRLLRLCPSENPVEVPGEVTDLNRAHIVRYVLSEGADVYEISHKRRSLEDVFLDLTEGLSSIPEKAAA